MRIKQQSLQELKKIITRDYGAVLSDEESAELAHDLLRLTRVAMAVVARGISNNRKARGSQRVPETTKPAQNRGALLPPEILGQSGKPSRALPGREEGISKLKS